VRITQRYVTAVIEDVPLRLDGMLGSSTLDRIDEPGPAAVFAEELLTVEA
jgi:hypothetical protein